MVICPVSDPISDVPHIDIRSTNSIAHRRRRRRREVRRRMDPGVSRRPGRTWESPPCRTSAGGVDLHWRLVSFISADIVFYRSAIIASSFACPTSHAIASRSVIGIASQREDHLYGTPSIIQWLFICEQAGQGQRSRAGREGWTGVYTP